MIPPFLVSPENSSTSCLNNSIQAVFTETAIASTAFKFFPAQFQGQLKENVIRVKHGVMLVGGGIENPVNALTIVHAAGMFGAVPFSGREAIAP